MKCTSAGARRTRSRGCRRCRRPPGPPAATSLSGGRAPDCLRPSRRPSRLEGPTSLVWIRDSLFPSPRDCLGCYLGTIPTHTSRMWPRFRRQPRSPPDSLHVCSAPDGDPAGFLEASTDGPSGAGFGRPDLRSAAKLDRGTSPLAAGASALEISRSACLRVHSP